jgi:hypothetical protein
LLYFYFKEKQLPTRVQRQYKLKQMEDDEEDEEEEEEDEGGEEEDEEEEGEEDDEDEEKKDIKLKLVKYEEEDEEEEPMEEEREEEFRPLKKEAKEQGEEELMEVKIIEIIQGNSREEKLKKKLAKANEKVYKWMAGIESNKIEGTIGKWDKLSLLKMVEMADQEIRQHPQKSITNTNKLFNHLFITF